MNLSKILELKSRLMAKNSSTGVIGIEFGPDGLAVSSIEPGYTDEKPIIDFCAFIPNSDPIKQVEALQHIVKDKKWTGRTCSVVMHPSAYQLLLVDAPDIPEEELKDAMRFRIKDLIKFSLEECVVEAFQLPNDAYRGRLKMVYTAATNEKIVETLIDYIELSALNLWQIEISELAIRNLASLSPYDQQGVAILWLKSSCSYLNLCHNSDLYLSRKFDAGIASAQSTPQLTSFQSDMEQLTLEIQRSLDYYESQLGKGSVHCIYLAPLSQPAPGVIEFLQQNLPVSIEPLDMTSLFSDCPNITTSEQALCMTAIGTAIRSPGYYDEAEN